MPPLRQLSLPIASPEETVALFRYGLIADLLHLPPGDRTLHRRLREKAEREYDIPASARRRVAAETLRDWLYAYRRGGFDALKPRPRRDTGQVRALPQAVADQLCTLKEAHPTFSVAMLIATARQQQLVPPEIVLLNAVIQPFQQPERVVGFFNTYRELYPVSRAVLRDIATQYQHWVTARVREWDAPLVKAPAEQRRDRFVDPYFRRAQPERVVVVLKAREPARILTAIGKDDRWHLQYARRWVDQYNFYFLDQEWGRMFVRVCPYFPFAARVCLNQHHWLAQRLRCEGIRFRQCGNAFLTCSDPARLQQLADSLTARDLERCAQKWLRAFTPFFTPTERRDAACQHRLFFSQVEYCDNLIFHRRAAVEALGERLFDANRTIGQPTTLAAVFGRKVTKRYRGKLETLIEDLDLPNPVIRSYYRDGSIKQYVRDHLVLRTEATSNNVVDFRVPKAVTALPQLRPAMATIVDRYLTIQQDILETFVDRGQLRQLAAPTRLPSGRRIPGRKLDHPRQLALMHALVRFAHIAASDTFTIKDLHPVVAAALDLTPEQYRLSSLRYQLSKLRAKGLVERMPRSRRYRLLPEGYRISLIFLKLFDRVYAPLTAGLLSPVTADARLAENQRHQLDRLYQRLLSDLDALFNAVGLKSAA